MSSNTHEARELLRLFKCVVDTGTDVLASFANVKLLPTFNGNFKQFLDDKKHEILHLWQSQKLLCCECPPAGCNLKRKRCMDTWIFKTFYDDSGPENTGHIVRNSRDIVQVCLHKYITRNISIEELDISTITFLLRNLAILSLNETTSLNIITETRNQICHAYSMNCYTMALMNTTWSELENALVDLTVPSFKRIIREQVKFLRKADLEKEEITELKNNVEKVLLEVKNSSDNNVGYLIGMETRLENKSINNTEDIKQHTTEETSYFAAQAQQALSENIQNTEDKLLQKVQSSSNDNVLYLVGMENRLENKSVNNTEDIKQHTTEETSLFATQIQKTLSEKIQNTGDIVQKEIGTKLHEHWSKMQEVEEKKQVMFMEMYRKINNIELSVKCERPVNLFVPEKACTDTTECPVLWHMEIPKDWNPEAIIATLRDQSNKLFKIKFVRKGSLIMLTTISASILSDSELFEAAVMSFLTKMMEDCDINTEIPGRVEVKLHILNANEVSISFELPPEGQNKHVSHSYSQTSPYECSNCFKKDEQLSLFEQRQHNPERGTLGLEQTISDDQCVVQGATCDLEAEKATGPDKDTDNLCSDIVILHSDTDTIEAQTCQKMLIEHINVPHLKVDLSTPGSPLLSTMFNTCRLMFIFQTKNFESDPQASFGESLQDPQIRRRIIPLVVDKTIVPELSPIIPLQYVKDITDRKFPSFKRRVEKLVEYWRRVLP